MQQLSVEMEGGINFRTVKTYDNFIVDSNDGSGRLADFFEDELQAFFIYGDVAFGVGDALFSKIVFRHVAEAAGWRGVDSDGGLARFFHVYSL